MLTKLSEFEADLDKIEKIFFELAAKRRYIESAGLGRALRRIGVYETSVLDDFSENLNICTKFAKFINLEIANQLSELLKETGIEIFINQIAVRMRISERERFSTSLLSPLFSRYGSVSMQLFSDESIHLENLIASLRRLKLLIKSLRIEGNQQIINDDEIFKPSNVDINIVNVQINLAINNIQANHSLQETEKDTLVNYLKEAKLELASDTPSWKKIIGALVICATLLSGLADAPQAFDNVNNAIKHILGTSIDKTLLSPLPPPPLIDQIPKEIVTA